MQLLTLKSMTHMTMAGRSTTYPLQHILSVIAELHEQGHFPAGVAVDGINLGDTRRGHNKEKTGIIMGWILDSQLVGRRRRGSDLCQASIQIVVSMHTV